MRYFDYETVAAEAEIAPEKLSAVARSVREEFPRDDMMYELHLMRVCSAIRDGHVGLEEALRSLHAA